MIPVANEFAIVVEALHSFAIASSESPNPFARGQTGEMLMRRCCAECEVAPWMLQHLELSQAQLWRKPQENNLRAERPTSCTY